MTETKLTKEMVDEWIANYISQISMEKTASSTPPNIVKQLMDRAKRNGGNANNQT